MELTRAGALPKITLSWGRATDALLPVRVAVVSLLHSLPAIFPFREFVEAGGLASYGTNLADTYRRAVVSAF